MSVEIELQYLYRGASPPLVPIELAGFALETSVSFAILDTYFDTDRLALRRSGCSLRIRQAHNLPTPLLVWKGPSTRRHDGAKEREETEIPLDRVPAGGQGVYEALAEAGLMDAVADGRDLDDGLHEIGQLHNDRSAHTYVQGLHRLELTWDRLTFPVGPPQARIEVEARSDPAARYLGRVDAELRELFGDDLEPAPQGKSRELCERLYPELVAA